MKSGKRGPVIGAERRAQMADAFLKGGERYELVRPGYPIESLDWVLDGLQAPGRALDVGAGTGKYTSLLVERGLGAWAVDPSVDMLAHLRLKLPQATTVVARAESLPLAGASMGVAVVAQAWHWFDPLVASAELARVLRPGGRLGLVWNQLDVSVPWVHRLSRIMHAGDVLKEGFRPFVGPAFVELAPHETSSTQLLTPLRIIELAKSRSYYLRANETVRAKVVANLSWYLHEHLGHAPETLVALPYRTVTWRATKAE